MTAPRRPAPAISIVMCFRNHVEFLQAAIQSVKDQTWTDWELIVVADGSTDRSVEIVQAFQKSDPRILLERIAPSGVSLARNRGVALARADWVAILDADDLWLPRKLERQMELVAGNPDLVVVSTWGHYLGTRGLIRGLHAVGPRSEHEQRRMLDQDLVFYLLTPSVLFRKEAFLRAGMFPAEFSFAEDIVAFTRMARLGAIRTIPEPLMHYRVHSRSASSANLAFQRQVARYIRYNLREVRAGRAQLSFAAFGGLPEESGRISMWNHRRKALGAVLYRRAGGLLADRRWIAGLWFLLLASLVSPSYVLFKLRRQIFRGEEAPE